MKTRPTKEKEKRNSIWIILLTFVWVKKKRNWSRIFTFYDIQLSTISQCINLLNLVMVFVQRHISLRPHPMRHEHDTAIQAPYPNLMWLCTVVNSKIKTIHIQLIFFSSTYIRKLSKITYVFANDCDAYSHYSGLFYFKFNRWKTCSRNLK